MRIVGKIINTQSDKLFQVAKSNENNFHYNIQIWVSNEDLKKEIVLGVGGSHGLTFGSQVLLKRDWKNKKLYGLYAVREFTKDEILGCYMWRYVKKKEIVKK